MPPLILCPSHPPQQQDLLVVNSKHTQKPFGILQSLHHKDPMPRPHHPSSQFSVWVLASPPAPASVWFDGLSTFLKIYTYIYQLFLFSCRKPSQTSHPTHTPTTQQREKPKLPEIFTWCTCSDSASLASFPGALPPRTGLQPHRSSDRRLFLASTCSAHLRERGSFRASQGSRPEFIPASSQMSLSQRSPSWPPHPAEPSCPHPSLLSFEELVPVCSCVHSYLSTC